MSAIIQNLSSYLPDELECNIFLLAGANSPSNIPRYLSVAERVRNWLEPILYRVVDIDDKEKAKLFLSCLQLRPGFAKTSVKVLHLWPAVSSKQGAKILALCQGLQELTLQIVNRTNLLDEENPLCGPLRDLQLTTLCMNIASVFYGPNIYLPDLVLLRHVQRLHLTNGWVAWRGLFIGLHELSQLMHLSFHIRSPGQWMTHPEVLFEIFQHFLRLRVVVLWRMEYHASKEIYSNLVQQNLMDHRIVVFNSAHFTEYTRSISSFWEIAERVVQWRENNQMTDYPTTSTVDNDPSTTSTVDNKSMTASPTSGD
ncbi:hypothetical protein SCLCIDRAFT_24558 [Scleroderma citrinum Foug A]|uniref:F-box domain-containing protein n=1 Tax=Scleroderma citrinum Foug A TaxID=1036808 RepID=A0A0C3ADF3_9AGAM|nr:hypothetical protein SCLCIDRAFT_24558 [Scleroderma citrinum Foug A]